MAHSLKQQYSPTFKSSGGGLLKQATTGLKLNQSRLWQDFQAGDETAFATIYEQNASSLYGYGLKLVRDEDLVKDTIQDLFVELWDAKERLGKVQAITPYLLKSIRRKIINRATKERRKTVLDELDLFEQQMVPSTEHSLIEKQQFDRKRQKIEEALAKLNKNQREVIHLKYYCRISYKEIAEIMETDKKSVYNLMARTVKQLRQHLDLHPFWGLLLSLI